MGPARARLLTKVIWAGASRWCGFWGMGLAWAVLLPDAGFAVGGWLLA
jgi:hypothetical protein